MADWPSRGAVASTTTTRPEAEILVQCAVCSVQCAVCSVQCAVCSVQCALCSVQRAVPGTGMRPAEHEGSQSADHWLLLRRKGLGTDWTPDWCWYWYWYWYCSAAIPWTPSRYSDGTAQTRSKYTLDSRQIQCMSIVQCMSSAAGYLLHLSPASLLPLQDVAQLRTEVTPEAGGTRGQSEDDKRLWIND